MVLPTHKLGMNHCQTSDIIVKLKPWHVKRFHSDLFKANCLVCVEDVEENGLELIPVCVSSPLDV